MKRALSAALAAIALVAVGCGSTHTATAPVATVPILESARTPEGARPAPPPPVLYQLGPGAKHIDSAGLLLIERFEGYRRCAYWDPYGRVWTAGFGQTHGISSSFCFANEAAAQANLKASVENEYEWAIRAVVGSGATQNEWDALCDFAYNLGAGIFVGQLRVDLEHHELYAAGQIMLGYDHAGGVVLSGLRERREAEDRLLVKPEPKPKPSRAALLNTRAALRRDLAEHGCRLKPYHGRGRYHAICARWLAEGQRVNAELKG